MRRERTLPRSGTNIKENGLNNIKTSHQSGLLLIGKKVVKFSVRKKLNIDPRHNYFQPSTMVDDIEKKCSLFITRHATQELLRSTFNAQPSVTYGLLRGQNGVAQAVCPFNHHPAPATMAKIVQSPESGDMELLALYASSVSRNECVDEVRNRTMQAVSGTDGEISACLRELPLLMVRLNTKGRMEIALFGNTPVGEIELPLILQEERTIPLVV